MTRACHNRWFTAASCLPAWLLAVSVVFADEPALFSVEQPLELELHIERAALCRDPEQTDCADVPARLLLSTSEGATQTLSIRVRTRGDWRLDPRHCTYPPLFLLFGDDAEGTVFEGQGLLPMTTQCRRKAGRYKDWVLREYLAYRIYQLLSEKSVRTRLVRVTWAGPTGEKPAGPFWSFLAEHFRFMAARNDAELVRLERVDLRETDPMEMATLDLFQFMIGHTDWSAVGGHNTVPIRDLSAQGNSGITVVPYDFDFSGLVAAHYAGPHPDLPIDSTRQRLYRGYCLAGIDWDSLFARFQAIRPGVFELVETLPGLSSAGRRDTRRFLQGFYRIIDDPERRQEEIIERCRRL